MHVPILAGGYFPKWPGRRRDTAIWKSAAEKWARAVAATYIEHGPFNDPVPLDYDGVVKILQKWSAGSQEQKIRYSMIYDVARGLSVKKNHVMAFQVHRGENATKWQAGDYAEHQRNCNDDYNSEEKDDGAIQASIDIIQKIAQTDPTEQDATESYIRETTLFLNECFDMSNCSSGNKSQIQIDEVPIYSSAERVSDILAVLPSLKKHDKEDTDQQDTIANPIHEVNQTIELNNTQRATVNHLKDWLVHLDEFKASPATRIRPKPFKILLHGGPGTGKSTTVNTFLKEIDSSKTRCCAPMGVAATIMLNGRTIHELLSFKKKKKEKRMDPHQLLDPLSDKDLYILKQSLQGVEILIIDEISMVDSVFMAWIHQRLCQVKQTDEDFGGLSVLACGDFFQLDPVSGTSLSKKLMAPRDDIIENRKEGRRLFKSFQKIELTVQQRSTDQNHTENILRCHDFENSTLTTLEMVNQYDVLRRNDIVNDNSWNYATVLVTSNREKTAIKLLRSRHLAKSLGLPLIRWERQPSGTVAAGLPRGRLDYIYQDYTGSTGMFVPTSPAYINENINVPMGLANGTACEMHSITLNPETSALDEDNIKNALPGQDVWIQKPLSINVKLINQKASLWPELGNLAEKTVDSRTGRLVVTDIIIPIGRTTRNHEEIKPAKDLSISFVKLRIDPGFAATFHKCQGKTLARVILDINKRPGRHLSTVTFSGFYVGISRVRLGDHVRFLPIRSVASEQFLKRLRPAPHIQSWLNMYRPESGSPFLCYFDDSSN